MSLLSLKNKRGGCWRTLMAADPRWGLTGWLYQLVPPKPGLWQALSLRWPLIPGRLPGVWTPWDTMALLCELQDLTLAGYLEMCFNKLPNLSVGSFEGCECCGKWSVHPCLSERWSGQGVNNHTPGSQTLLEPTQSYSGSRVCWQVSFTGGSTNSEVFGFSALVCSLPGPPGSLRQGFK